MKRTWYAHPRTLLSTLTFVSSLSACYTYQPSPVSLATAAEPVRVHLTEPGKRRVWGLMSPGRPFLDGHVVRTYEDSLLIEVTIPGEEMTSFQQRVSLRTDEIVSLQVRHLDRFRTSIAGGLFAALTTSMAVSVLSGKAGGGAYPPKDDGQTELRIPIVQRRIR